MNRQLVTSWLRATSRGQMRVSDLFKRLRSNPSYMSTYSALKGQFAIVAP